MAKRAERRGRPDAHTPSREGGAKARRPTGRGPAARTQTGTTPSPPLRPPSVRQPQRRTARSWDERDLSARAAEQFAHELEVSRQGYADLYDLAPIGYASLDSKGVIREINLAGAAFLGTKRAALLGRPLLALVAPPDRRKLSRHLSRCRTEPGTVSTEIRLLRRGGQQAIVQINSRRAVGLDGEARLLTTLHDLTLQRQAEAALRESEANFRGYFENLSVGTAQIDAAGHFIRVNDRFCEITGYPREELLGGMGPLDLDHPDEREADRERIARFFRGKDPYFETEKRYVRKNGDVVWVHVSAGAVRDAAGQLRYTAGVIENITQRKQAEEALRQSEERLALAASGTRVGMFEWDTATGEILCNEQVVRLLGLRSTTTTLSERYCYRDWADRVHPEDLPQVEAELHRCMAEHAPFEAEYRVVWPDASVHWLVARGLFRHDDKDKPPRMLGMMMDVTERKAAEAVAATHRRWDEARADIGKAAVSGASLNEIMQSALDTVALAAGAPVGMIRLVDPESRTLILVAGRNLLPAYRQVAGRTRWGEYLAGQVAATGEIRAVEDVSVLPGLSLLSQLTDPPIVSLIGMPLQAQGEVIGTLALGYPQARRFEAGDFKELLPCANMIAGVIRAERLREALRREAEARTLLLRELNHRVRNNLAALIGFLHLAADKMEGAAASALNAVAERVGHLAELHQLEGGGSGGPAELRGLVEFAAKGLLFPAVEDLAVRWRVDGASARIPAAQVIPVTLVLNELLINCIKHAFRGRSTGSVAVEIHRIGGDVCLEVSDDGPGPGPGPRGLGLDITEALVTETLQGSFRLVQARDGGALAIVRFPLRAELQVQEESA